MAHLSIFLFGPFHVTLSEERVARFEYDKVRALLAFLAVESDRPQRREFLAGLLWPEQPEAAALKSLRQALSKLRQAIGDQSAQPPFFHVSRDSIQFNLNSDVALDITAFSSLMKGTGSHRHRNPNTCPTCAHAWSTAAALYRGDFLSQFSLNGCPDFEFWVLTQRQMLHNQALEAFSALTNFCLYREEYQQAQRWARRQIEIEPLLESAYRQIMSAFALAGQRSKALSYYHSCRRILNSELGVEPEDETEKLRQMILGGALQNHQTVTQRGRENLPLPPSPFFGRERELSILADTLENPDIHLISLIGPGGIGKTSLALKAAAEHQEQFAHGVSFVSLVQLTSPEEIYPALAAALFFSLEGNLSPKTQLLNYLKRREVLIILDNFEHLLPMGADTIGEILDQARHLVLLVTTTERLNLQVEYAFPIAGLEFPVRDRDPLIRSYSAVDLFLQVAHRNGISLNEQESDAVKRLCRLVEGNPLALELAASLLHSISCQEMVAEVETGLDLLTTTRRDALERHRSIRSLFNYSWRLLVDSERSVFRKLSVFRGGFSRKSATYVAGASLDKLSALIDKSLLQLDPITGRYKTHGLLAKYAREMLDQAGETQQTLERHLTHFMAFAEEADEGLNQAQLNWLEQVDLEFENLQVAFETALSAGEAGIVPAVRLSGALGRYWLLRGRWAEGQGWLNRALVKGGENPLIPVDAAIRALYWAGILAIYKGESLQAEALAERALLQSREGAALWSQALVSDMIGNLKRIEGDNTGAKAFHAGSLHKFRLLDDPWGICISLNNLFRLAYRSNDYQKATKLAEESLKLARETGDHWNMTLALDYLGIVAHDQGEYVKGIACLEESLSISRALGPRFMVAHAIYWLGRVARSQGSPSSAAQRFEESLALYRDLGSSWGQAVSLQGLGLTAFDEGDLLRAEKFLSVSRELLDNIGDKQLIAFVQISQGDVACAKGEYERAAELYTRSLEILRNVGDRWLVALALSGLAVLAVKQNEYDRAAYLFAAEDGLRAIIGTPRSTVEQALANPSLLRLKRVLAGTGFQLEIEDGKALAKGDLNVRIDFALHHVKSHRRV